MDDVTFDPDKMRRLIQSDQFLSFAWEQRTNAGSSGDEAKDLETFFNTYVLGDSEMEQSYMEIQK